MSHSTKGQKLNQLSVIMIAPLFGILYKGLPGGTFPSAHHIYNA